MILDMLRSWQQQFSDYRQRYSDELKELPDGRLTCSHGKDGLVRYYCDTYDDNAQRQRKGVSKNRELRNQLAWKAYLERMIKALDVDITELERLARRWVPCSPQDVIGCLPRTFENLPVEAFFDQRKDLPFAQLSASETERVESHRAWGAQEYDRSMHYPEGLTNTTTFGLKVRSKAESLIAEKLHEYGIPFRYEQKLYLNGQLLVPDFTFEAADGSQCYLEFCGMMDDPEYVSAYNTKCMLYEDAGIVPWRNIEYLYAAGNTLDMQIVDAVIRTQVMAWL